MTRQFNETVLKQMAKVVIDTEASLLHLKMTEAVARQKGYNELAQFVRNVPTDIYEEYVREVDERLGEVSGAKYGE